jgi:hypothetical protein
MTLFYFDLSRGDRQCPDEEGTDLPDAEEARSEAIEALVAMGKDYRARLANGALSILVRQNGKPLFRATLSLTLETLT